MRGCISKMKIVSINASPNKAGSTSLLLKTVEEELKQQGDDFVHFNLYDYHFKGCLACSACSKPDTHYCSQQDDLIPVLEAIDGAQAVLFGSPIYIGHITGTGKTFIDRLYTFLCSKERSQNLKKKAYAYILTQGAELKYFESVRTYMDDWFYEYFGMKNGGSLVVGDLGGAKDLEKQPQAMENAKAVAHQLHQSLIAE